MSNEAGKIRNFRSESREALLVNICVLLAISVGVWYFMPYSAVFGTRNMLFMNLVCNAITLFFMAALEKYSVLFSNLSEKIIINVLSSLYTLVIACGVNLVLFLSPERLWADLAMTFCTVVLVSLGDLIMMKRFSRYKTPRLLIINSTRDTFLRMKRIKYGMAGFYDAWYERLDGKNGEEFRAFVEEKFAAYDAVCVLNGLNEEQYDIALKTAVRQQKELFIVPNMIDVGKTNATLVRFDDVLTLYMPKIHVTKAELAVKRAMDIVISAIGLVLAAIPMLLIAAAIKLTSPGPVFYKQERLTIGKRPFMIIKFRTMIPDAEKLTGPKFAEKDDPRITKIGKVLRACRLDELPQLINILKGDMSVVGPRPERPMFVAEFEKQITNYSYRFAVKAGLTSLSHVYGRYSTYIHDRTYYDLFYITNYSVWMDLKIMLLTSKTMFIKTAAEGVEEYAEDSPEAASDGEAAEKETMTE